MPTRLILVAHGATSATRLGIFPRDEALDEKGSASVRAVASRLPKIERCLTSPARAARETAAILASAAGSVESCVDNGLRDLDLCEWAGKALTQVAAAGEAWISDPGFTGHGGESLADLRARVQDWLAAAMTVPHTTLAVTHGAVIRAALLAVLDAPPHAFWRIDVPPLGMLALHADGRRWAIRALEPPDGALSPISP